MNQIYELYDSIPLPFKYCKIPTPDEPDIVRKVKRYYSVNHVITGITRTALKHSGFSPTSNKSKWNTSWGRQFDSSQYQNCQSWQKVNHFSGAYLIGRKDQFHKRMTELRNRAGQNFASFYPKSFLLPEDSIRLQKSWKKKALWIIKPVASSRGRGIRVLSSRSMKPPQKSGKIVQHYISRPLLITGRKFDIRIYALVTSVAPIRIYMHKSGLARFATHAYDPKAPSDRHMHLTNFSVNKNDEHFVRDGTTEKIEANSNFNFEITEKIENSKWSLDFLLKYLEKNHSVSSSDLLNELEKVVATTLVTGMAEVRSFHSRHVLHRHTSYELYGVDVILDENLCPYVMEINISPSLNATEGSLDFKLKYPLVLDVLRMARIVDCNPKSESPCPGITQIDKECRLSMKGRTTDIESLKRNPWENPVFADYVMVRDFIEEKQIQSEFRRIYPKRKNISMFDPCFASKRYHDIVFGEWIKKSNSERLKVLKKNFSKYTETMNHITESLSKK
ncbi:Tubulin-tyrosine ligase family protein [Tritrichomonas foetus]|uniref:Tubulin--tyrosine ligase-like protein 5 n=1 Tax=Tritrichomonas foetus TaxID=1144522 RepID=A0A1J4JVL3_9EUKA|nr:Tubulin-tyrosine ligase family protein [Tritrichomonas foetus]|eukprot:OHT01317.1 Tubulin-tyrosine ligase family protein [Tritrichomonas foetus]